MPGVEMPGLIDYQDDMESKTRDVRKRKKRQLVDSLRYARREMNRCLNMLQELEVETRIK